MSGRLTPPVGSHDHVQGGDSFEVTLVEYGDYECPHCGRAFPIVERVKKRMGRRLRFVFRNFPLSEIHPHAEHAAEATESAAANGGPAAFWELHRMIFEHQQDGPDALSDDALAQYAEDAGFKANAVLHDIRSGTYRERVRADFMSGVHSGVNGTPTFFIEGVRYDGSWDEESLLDALDAAARAGI